MPRKRLAKASEVLLVIQRWIATEGQPPTIEELREELGVGSTRTVLRYLRGLEKDGAIRRWSGSRGMQVLRRPETGIATTPVPLVGEAPAGALMLAEENLEGWLRMPTSLLRPPGTKHFLLRVRGNSMNRARVGDHFIESGDLLLVRQESTAESGRIVVALVDGEATIKRLVKGDGFWVLKPESSKMQNKPIILTEDFQVQGVVTKVLKGGGDLIQSLDA